MSGKIRRLDEKVIKRIIGIVSCNVGLSEISHNTVNTREIGDTPENKLPRAITSSNEIFQQNIWRALRFNFSGDYNHINYLLVTPMEKSVENSRL
jgi:hypothetical protein